MRLSVVVPAYNVEGHIPFTLRSLASLTQPPYEVLVVDDGSTDGTALAIHEAAAAHPLRRFRLVQQVNSGVSVARNRGFAEASGDYVLFLDGDDLVTPDMAQQVTAAAHATERPPDVICWRFYDESAEKRGDFPETYWDPEVPDVSSGPETLRRILVHQSQSLWIGAVAFRRVLLLENGLTFTPGRHSAQDTEFLWRALAKARTVVSCRDVLSTYVWRQGSTTNSRELNRFDGFLAYVDAVEFLADNLGEEAADIVRAASRKQLPRFTGPFLIYCRSHPHGGVELLRALECRNPGTTQIVRRLIRDEMKSGGVDNKWKFFLVSPRLAASYLGSPYSHAPPPGLLGFGVNSVRRVRRTLSRRVKNGLVVRGARQLRLDLALRRLQRRGTQERILDDLIAAWGNSSYSADQQYLREVINRGLQAGRVLECGSGLTTVALGSLGVRVWSLEHDEGWRHRVSEALSKARLGSVSVEHAPLRSYGDFDWYSVPAGLPSTFDLVVCDGPPGRTRGGRKGLFDAMKDNIAGATVLLDDAHRPAERVLLKTLETEGWTHTLHGSGEKRYAVLTRAHIEPAQT